MTASPSPSPSPSAPPGAPGFGSSLGQLIDVLVQNDQQICALMARRAVLLDEARRVSESALPQATASYVATGWNARVVTRRELVSSVACALRLPERTAEHLIEISRSLVNDLHATREALASGAITYRHSETIVDHATSLPSESMEAFEQAVLEVAPTLTNTQLDRRAGRIRERMHPSSIGTRHTAAVEKRCLDLSPARNGMAWLTAFLPAATATAAYNRVTDLALNVEGPGEAATLTQLRADVFADLLVDGITYDLPDEVVFGQSNIELAPAAEGRPVRTLGRGFGRGVRATVHLTVPVLTLLGTSDEQAVLEGYGPIDPATAKKVAAGAPSFHRILTHPETGAVLSVGRDSYTVPKDLRRWLIIRDETCRFPGCSRAARRSDVDHSLDWQHSGTTVHDNLAHLCPAHHRVKHQTAWTYTQHPGGRLEWTAPTGHRYATAPAVYFQTTTSQHPAAVPLSLDPFSDDPFDYDARNLDAKYLDPRYLDPRYLDPRYLDPEYLGPEYGDGYGPWDGVAPTVPQAG